MTKMLEMIWLERSRRRWRLVAVLLILVVMVSVAVRMWASDDMDVGDHVARVTIEGIVMDDQAVVDMLSDITNDKSIAGVIVKINSPGGTMVGGLEIYEALRAMAAQKPVVSLMGTTAASAGYMIALGGDYIVASPGTLTGSIGVLLPLIDARELAANLGLRDSTVASGDLKDATSPLAVRGSKEKAYLQGLVDDLDKVFLGMVVERRKLTPAQIAIIKDGRALAGVQAKELNLVDELGHETAARTWLDKKLGKTLPVRDYEPADERGFLAKALEGQLRGVNGLMGRVLGGFGVLAVAY